MNIQQFERFLTLKKEFENFIKNSKPDKTFEFQEEYFKLKEQLEDLLFKSLNNREAIICKLRNALSSWKYSLNTNSKTSDILNEIKVIKEIINLLEIYDWKVMHSEYSTKDENENWITEVAIWEQNSEGQIRNYKKWKVDKPHIYNTLSHYKK